jgi:two-component system, cell cycle sensor histidine kinase and response regulator CckA
LNKYCGEIKEELRGTSVFECESYDEELGRYLRIQSQSVKPGSGKETGAAGGFAVLIVHDITESKQADKDRRLLSTTMNQADESIMITDTKGLIQYINPMVEQSSGYSRPDLIGQSASIFKSGKHDDQFYQDLWQTIIAKKTWRGSFINRKKNGVLYYEKQTITPILDDQDEIINYIALKRDVTHEVMLEERLRQSLKMEAVGVMTGGITHEISRPLNSLKVTADGMLFWHTEGKEILPEKTLRKIEKISREADRISATVRNMYSFFRRDAVSKPAPIGLGKVI